MSERTTRTSVTFLHPFSLTDVDGVQPAGTYWIETVDAQLGDLSFVAYRRVSTTVELPAAGTPSSTRQLVTIDPVDLAAVLQADKACGDQHHTRKETL